MFFAVSIKWNPLEIERNRGKLRDLPQFFSQKTAKGCVNILKFDYLCRKGELCNGKDL